MVLARAAGGEDAAGLVGEGVADVSLEQVDIDPAFAVERGYGEEEDAVEVHACTSLVCGEVEMEGSDAATS